MSLLNKEQIASMVFVISKTKWFFKYRIVTVEELFAYFLGIYIKFSYKNPLFLTLLDLVDVALKDS